jgi:hypothetical protein
VVRILQELHSEYALLGIESCQPAVKIQEDRLYHFFGFTRIFDNPRRNTEDKFVVAIKENRKGILLSFEQAKYEPLVAEFIQRAPVFGIRIG